MTPAELPPPPPIQRGPTFDLFVRAAELCDDASSVWCGGDFLFAPGPDGDWDEWERPFDHRRYGPSPKNAVPFLTSGVDGVHWTLLAVDGAVREASPVVEVCPMDGPDYWRVEARSFLDYVCPGGGPIRDELRAVLDRERAGEEVLTDHLPVLEEQLRLTDPFV